MPAAKNKILAVIVFFAIIIAAAYIARNRLFPLFFLPQHSSEAAVGIQKNQAPEGYITLVAENLEIPWEIAFLPDGRLLVTERPGRLLVIGKERTVIPVSGVRHIGEGGLLGMALHPYFEKNNLLYLYITTETDAGLENRVERYVFQGDGTLAEKKVILAGIPGARFHNGGRMNFGPDGYLYITTGDAADPGLAQDTASLAGKILRVGDDGFVPDDNPFGNEVYSFGHRNPQGIAWDSESRLWSTEHGATARDELNLIEPGKNYGWPVIQGNERRANMETPVLFSGTEYTWAPSGTDYIKGSVFFGGLRGQALYQALTAGEPVIRSHFKREFGRIRIVKTGPDGMLYIGTSNRDGRGLPENNDDRIFRINPALFNSE